jgi:GH15 family glucan-1,4-alpha-glucosidase
MARSAAKGWSNLVARSVILGNGRLTVGLNEMGLVHDFYYPYVGLENLTTSRSVHHKIGVWVADEFTWTDDGTWETYVNFSSDALISEVWLRNHKLGIALELHDFVDYEYDVLCRMVTIHNESEDHKSIRLFMHQVFEISRGGRADTALYVPDDNYILDYKGRVTLLVSGQQQDGSSFDQFAVGNYGIEGKQGTFMDAEDGELSNHLVEHGGVDSVIRFSAEIEPHHTHKLDYWIVASDTQFNGEIINKQMQNGLQSRYDQNQRYWQRWLSTGASRLQFVPHEDQALLNKSLMVIKAHTDDRGGIIASCDSSIYNFGRDYYSYVWPRDGAYAMWPLIRLGYTEEPKAFFRFCRDILTPGGYLMHKYQPDRAIGSTWHPLMHNDRKELAIQEDETAVITIMLGEFYNDSSDDSFIREMFEEFIVPSTEFLCNFTDEQTGLPHASYDLWEEKFLCSAYTTATVYRALLVAADFAEKFGTGEQSSKWRAAAEELFDRRTTFVNPDRPGFRKGFLLGQDGSLDFDNTLDLSSLYGIITFGYFDEEDRQLLQDGISEIEASMYKQSESGGTPRYENDNYFRVSEDSKANPWIISTLWLAQFYIRFRQFDEAREILEWVKTKALESGVLPEQVDPDTGESRSVTPLVWSHAEFINTVLDISHLNHKQKSE